MPIQASKISWRIIGAFLLCAPIIHSFSTLAQSVYKLNGTIGGKYIVVIELEEHEDNYISGRYAYTSTLRKNGDVECSWLSINPSYNNPETQWTIRDCKSDVEEEWFNVNFIDYKHLTARMKNNNRKSYDISATVVETRSNIERLDSYLKMHIGEYAFEFRMFDNPKIKTRLTKLLGAKNFLFFKSIYEVTISLEYNAGMVWASGFKAHQCCDPATLWAYNTHSDSFFIWIRVDERDYWWSESGIIPVEFRALVDLRF